MGDPESIVRSFIRDYCRWSERASARCEKDPSLEAIDVVDAEYGELLKQYCRPDFIGKNTAFASPSMHDPNTETIREVIIDNTQAVIRTTNTDSEGFATDYEYSLGLENGIWFLEGLDLIDDQGPGPVL
jgi:hypothetical protein